MLYKNQVKKEKDHINEGIQIKRKLKIMFKTTDIIMWNEYLIWWKSTMAKSLFDELSGTYERQAGRLSCRH